MSSISAPGFPIVLAAPSGTGKTTIARELVERSDRFVFSISVTTREIRRGERGGRDYRFVSPEEFRGMVSAGAFAEWAEVHGNLYGTPREALEGAMRASRCPVLDIDVQGARQIRAAFPEAVLVFVLPPSAEELEARLRGRATERTADVERRLRAASGEFAAALEFDFVVVNDEVQGAVSAVEEIVRVESARVARLEGLEERLAELRRAVEGVLDGDRGSDPS